MRIFWGNSLNKGIGNALGYSTHYKNIKAALERAGCVDTFDTDLAISITTGENFIPVPGKFNVLYTMYEITFSKEYKYGIPDKWVDKINQADLLIVPCSQNINVFRPALKKSIPIEVVHEGCDTSIYTYRERAFPKDKPFVFLWVGATNPRKGFPHMGQAWSWFCQDNKELVRSGKVRCYMKTTGIKSGEKLQEKFGITVDSRFLSAEELVQLYHNAHCFVAPHMGEGWHLGCCEAAATGLPVIYTDYSGPREFLDKKVAYPLKWSWTEVATKIKTANGEEKGIQHTGYTCNPDITDIVKRMEQVYFGYEEALRRGRLASERINREFTWDTSAQKFLAVLKKYADKERLAA